MQSPKTSAVPSSKDAITIYLDPEIHEALRQWAELEDRSKTYLASKAVTEAVKAWMKQHGIESDSQSESE